MCGYSNRQWRSDACSESATHIMYVAVPRTVKYHGSLIAFAVLTF